MRLEVPFIILTGVQFEHETDGIRKILMKNIPDLNGGNDERFIIGTDPDKKFK